MLIATGTMKEIEVIPAGVHTAVCYGIIDLGVQVATFNDETSIQRKIMLLFELPDETYENESGEAIPRVISKQYTLSLHPRSSLNKMIATWRNKPFTDEEIKAGFDLSQIIGWGAQLSISNEKSKQGKPYAKIEGIMGLPKGFPAPKPTQKIRFDLDEPDALETMTMLPNWLQEIIKKSETYKAMTGETDLPFSDAQVQPNQEIFDNDDDLPF